MNQVWGESYFIGKPEFRYIRHHVISSSGFEATEASLSADSYQHIAPPLPGPRKTIGIFITTQRDDPPPMRGGSTIPGRRPGLRRFNHVSPVIPVSSFSMILFGGPFSQFFGIPEIFGATGILLIANQCRTADKVCGNAVQIRFAA